MLYNMCNYANYFVNMHHRKHFQPQNEPNFVWRLGSVRTRRVSQALLRYHSRGRREIKINKGKGTTEGRRKMGGTGERE